MQCTMFDRSEILCTVCQDAITTIIGLWAPRGANNQQGVLWLDDDKDVAKADVKLAWADNAVAHGKTVGKNAEAAADAKQGAGK